jgi:hypothetical protein
MPRLLRRTGGYSCTNTVFLQPLFSPRLLYRRAGKISPCCSGSATHLDEVRMTGEHSPQSLPRKFLCHPDSVRVDLNCVLEAARVATRQGDCDGYGLGFRFLENQPVAFLEAFE